MEFAGDCGVGHSDIRMGNVGTSDDEMSCLAANTLTSKETSVDTARNTLTF